MINVKCKSPLINYYMQQLFARYDRVSASSNEININFVEKGEREGGRRRDINAILRGRGDINPILRGRGGRGLTSGIGGATLG